MRKFQLRKLNSLPKVIATEKDWNQDLNLGQPATKSYPLNNDITLPTDDEERTRTPQPCWGQTVSLAQLVFSDPLSPGFHLTIGNPLGSLTPSDLILPPRSQGCPHYHVLLALASYLGTSNPHSSSY